MEVQVEPGAANSRLSTTSSYSVLAHLFGACISSSSHPKIFGERQGVLLTALAFCWSVEQTHLRKF